MLALSSYARADPITSLALEPAPAGDRGLAVERAMVRGDGLFSVRFLMDVARRPLVLLNLRGEEDTVLESQIWLHGLAALSLDDRLALHLDLPFVVGQAEGDHPRSGQAAPGQDAPSSVGDLRLGARLSLLDPAKRDRRKHDLAVGANLWFPTGGDAYSSNGAFRAAASFLMDGTISRFYWAANAGIKGRPSVQLGRTSPAYAGTALAAGAAAGVFLDANEALAIGPELAVESELVKAPLSSGATVAHVQIGAHYFPTDGTFDVGVSVGPDLGRGLGAADARVLLLCGIIPERALVPLDQDNDGIPDVLDACPTVPGVPSEDPNLNGCPIPPLDTDGDGIPDAQDACPLVFGPASPDPALNGCPVPPEPEPEPAPAPAPPVVLTPQQIVISQQIQFETASAVLLPVSDGLLSEVARLLNEHVEVELVEVQGHTDERGTAEYNQRLSQDRAASVVAWLVQHGVQRNRLTAHGYGRDRPIADNTTEEGLQKNRRVEFHVLRPPPPEPSPQPPPT
jgi:outer membrane protein OmpA-like peptidoglycan-associated protein